MCCMQMQISIKKKKKKPYLGGGGELLLACRGVDTSVLRHVLHMHVDVDRCKEKSQKER